MKPRDSSDEEHDLVGQPRGEPGNWAVAPSLPPTTSLRNVSGVVAAPGPPLDPEDEDEATTVGHGMLPLAEEQQVALSRRIRTALGQTLPLGTPAPGTVTNGGRRAWARTMMLGGRQVPGVPAPSARDRFSEFPEAFGRSESATPAVPAAVSPPVQQGRAEPTSDASAVRASFVRTVGLPTAPPPRRSRRPGAPESELPPPSEPAPSEPAPVSDSDHEAFALERPLTLVGLPAVGRRSVVEVSASPAAGAALSPARNEPTSRDHVTGQMLPPPPQPADYEPPSSPSFPSSLPPVSAPALAAVPAAAVPRARAATLLTDLPSANPFEGFEAPRDTFVQRFLIVFVVALAVVGIFALAAMAFGFLGKTGW